MSKKGLLNEATVRRFMGLAGMEAKIVSSTLKEMYHKRDDEEEKKMEEAKHGDEEEKKMEEAKHGDEEEKKMEEMKYKRDDEEEKKMEEGMYAEEEPAADDEMADEEPPDMDGDAEVELSPEQISKLKALKDAAMEAAEVVDMLDSAAASEEGGVDADEPADLDAPEEDEEVMEALSGINLELNEDELVQEVAKRVAKRLLKAKRAQQQLDEALGRRKQTK
jgi:hypothetical protein